MRMDKLTGLFQQALADAQSLAVGRDHPAIEPVHLMTAFRYRPLNVMLMRCSAVSDALTDG